MSYQILRDIEHEIIDAIKPIIDEYLQGRTAGTSHAINVVSRKDYDSYFDGQKKTIYDASKEFNKDKSITQLIKDIKYAGYRTFCNLNTMEGEKMNNLVYRRLVIKLLNEEIRDRIALDKDENDKKQKKIMNIQPTKTFEKYLESKTDVLNEMVLPVMKLDEIIDDVTVVSNDTLKRVLVSFYKTYEDYIDCTDKKKHMFKIHDMLGDILNNNRASFDVCVFDKGDIDRIKVNLVDFAIGEFHTSLPTNVNIFGNEMKPSSFLNKEELKTVFDGMFTPEEIIKIISNILGFSYSGQFNDFFIWDNKGGVVQSQSQSQIQSQSQVQPQVQTQVQTQPQIQETKSFDEFVTKIDDTKIDDTKSFDEFINKKKPLK